MIGSGAARDEALGISDMGHSEDTEDPGDGMATRLGELAHVNVPVRDAIV